MPAPHGMHERHWAAYYNILRFRPGTLPGISARMGAALAMPLAMPTNVQIAEHTHDVVPPSTFRCRATLRKCRNMCGDITGTRPALVRHRG